MVRSLIYLAVLFAVVAISDWLATNVGTVEVQWSGYAVTSDIGPVLVAVLTFMIITEILWRLVAGFLSSPRRLGRLFGNQRVRKGRAALSRGLIAVGAGDVRAAQRHAAEARRLIPEEAATLYLEAQAAQLAGDRDGARNSFEGMLDIPETEILGLRGLYMEADRQGALEAKRHFALEANRRRPGLPWAGKAVFNVRVAEQDWEAALRALESNSQNRLVEKSEARRLKVVLLTARALELEMRAPERARAMALEAHGLLPGFVPASVLAGRLLTRLGEIRKASRVLETAWRNAPHPEIAQAYLDVRPGDAARDRTRRAKVLADMRTGHPEGALALAQAAIDARDWSVARDTLTSVLRTRPTERACLMMADIEEGESNDLGRVREWLARAVKAPKDPVWIADGVVSEQWAPISPLSGKLDTYEWRVPAGPEVKQALEIEESMFKARPANEIAADPSARGAITNDATPAPA